MKSSSRVGRMIPLPDPFLGGFCWKWYTGSHSLHRRLLDTKWKRTKCKKSQNIKQASCWFKTIYERHKTVCNENNILPQSTQAPRLLCWQWVWMIKRRLWNESKGRRWTIRNHYSAYALLVLDFWRSESKISSRMLFYSARKRINIHAGKMFASGAVECGGWSGLKLITFCGRAPNNGWWGFLLCWDQIRFCFLEQE